MRRAMTIGAVALAAALTGAGAASAVAGATSDPETGPAAEPAAAAAVPVGVAAPVAGPAFGPLHGARGERMLYGEAVSADKDGKKHYHVWQHGKVTSVSASSVAVRSTDGTTWTWTVNDDTKVRSAGNKDDKDGKTEIGDVKTGDDVLVAGTRSGSTRTAARIIDPAPDFEQLRERRKAMREFGKERREDRQELRERLKDLREGTPSPQPS